MKKTLVALAAVSAVSAFAQVTITGNLDVAYASIGGSANQTVTGATVSSYIGSSTSAINIEAVEDLGGGVKSQARYEIDPRAFVTDGSALARHQSFVGLNGGFGNVRIGAIDSLSLVAYGVASPLGTATGSGYSATNATLGMTTRYNRSVAYTTADFGGLTASIYYTPGHDTTDGSTTAAQLTQYPLQRKATEYSVNYVQGPLTAALATLRTAASTTAGTAAPVGTAATDFTTLSANYKIASTTLYAGWNTGKTLGTAVTTTGPINFSAQTAGFATKGNRIGLKYEFGAYTAIVSMATQKTEATLGGGDFATRKVNGLRLQNDLSKTTAVYVAYESYDTGASSANKINQTAVGIRKQF